MKHKHCDMIIAKAKNKHLVQFLKVNDEWIECEDDRVIILFDERCEYFLCLPQHNENGQCLHWLNGGEVQVYCNSWRDCVTKNDWRHNHMFMDCKAKFRIKPEKEKRWIIATPDALASMIFKSKEKAEQVAEGGQVIEIEVEV
ncbi:MAG: hypothetical protein GY782_11850 [Gammaproteobacteria bacterium]|nr:hypothetical protein [Gammaproteobacteria bacterium]